MGTSRSHLGCYKENSWVWSKKREVAEAGLEGMEVSEQSQPCWGCPWEATLPAGAASVLPLAIPSGIPRKRSCVPSQPSPQPRHAKPNICKRRSPPWERRLHAEFTCPSNA